MRKDITVTAEVRESRGKNEARRLRVAGNIPAVLYGTGSEPVAVTVSPKQVGKILNSASGSNTIFNLQVAGGEDSPVKVVDWQNHPVKGTLMHIDLMRIDLTRKLTVKVPVHTTGEAKGVKQQGGLFELVAREIVVECLPDDIPEHYTVDVTELLIGQSIRAKNVPLADGIKLISNPELVLAHVVVTRGAAETTETAAVAVPGAPEPEVIKKGKKEEEAAEKSDKKEKK
jgi:large subunit ribosomal protein L25